MNNGLETIVSPTINGLKSLNLDTLDVDTLQSNNIDGDFFSIKTIEANDVQVDNELELTNNGFITIGKNTGTEITISDIQIGYLDGISSNIQSQIDNVNGNTSQLQNDLTEAEDDINDIQSSIGIILGVQDDLYSKTILQSASSINQKTTFSGKLILSSLSNLDIGVEIQANTANVGILTTNVNSNTSNISSLSTQQSTNSILIQNNTLSIGSISGGPTNSLFDRVQNINASPNVTYTYGLSRQLNPDSTTTDLTQITLNGGIASLRGVEPQIYLYKNGATGGGQSGIIGFQNNTTETLIINNYQQNKNIDIFTNSSGTTDQINIGATAVNVNGVNVNNKFTTIDSDILGLSNTASSLDILINNNSNDITTLQTQIPPIGSIMIYSGSSPPSGWLLCHGQSLSKILYADLWNVIGDTYINNRPVRTSLFYNLDLRQLFVTGAGNNASGYSINATTKSLGEFSSQSIMEHGHSYERPTNTFKSSESTFGTNVWRSNTQSVTSSGVILPGGGSLPGGNNSECRPYCMSLNYIIKT